MAESAEDSTEVLPQDEGIVTELSEAPDAGETLDSMLEGDSIGEESSTEPDDASVDGSDDAETSVEPDDMSADESVEEEPVTAEEPEEEVDTLGVVGTVINRSPESTRLFVIGSSEFLSDQSIRMISSSAGSLYSNSFQFIANLIDVAMEDASLLSIRSRGHFNRTLPPLSSTETRVFEYGNYAAAVVGLVVVFLLNLLVRTRRRVEHTSWLGGRS